VLLYLHGGPVGSVLATSSGWQPWEKYFTVVLWDQRGAGRTFRKTGRSVVPTMTVPRMAQDGLEVAEFLRTRLHKDKIVLVGHSWGSILGINMIKQRPDLFAANVGTGQVVNLQKNEALNYAHVLAQSQAAHNQRALKDLASIGPPPCDNIRKIGIERKWADALAARSGDALTPMMNAATPDFSLTDLYFFDCRILVFTRTAIGRPLRRPRNAGRSAVARARFCGSDLFLRRHSRSANTN